MKIISLRFKNINSLAGENEIDFTNPVFTQEGLFAITGKTGAGKSSILDAITLALYGKTPRVEITGSDNAVITRGEKDCYAEIIFEVTGKIWKSAWKQERTRSGTLKPVNRSIADAADTIIADQVRTCDQKIVEIIGLSFEQFTKVIMLAQGSFAAFLQAKQNEKGELLEQITGTEIYAEISKKVFERTKTEKEKLDKIQLVLSSHKLLSEQEVELHKQEISLLEENKKGVNKQLLQVESAIKHLQDVSQLNNQMAAITLLMPQLAEQASMAKMASDNAERAYHEAKQFQEKQAPLFKRVREIDTKISEKNKQLQPIHEEIEQHNKKIAELTKTKEKDQEALLEVANLLQEKQEWANKNRNYELLVGQYAALEAEYISLQTFLFDLNALGIKNADLQKHSEAKKVSLELATKLVAETEQALVGKTDALRAKKDQLAVLLNGSDLHSLQTKKEELFAFGHQLKTLQDLELAMANLNSAIVEWGNKLNVYEGQNTALLKEIDTNKNALAVLEVQINLLDENIVLTKTIQSLEAHRLHLIDGLECPLCGSLEHPFAKGNLPQLGEKEKELAVLKRQLQSHVLSVQQAEKQLAKIGSDREHAIQNKAKEELVYEETMLKHEMLLSEINKGQANFLLPVGPQRMEALQAILDEKRQEGKVLTDMLKKATDCEQQLVQIRDTELVHLQQEFDVVNKQKNTIETDYKLAAQQWQESKNTFQALHDKYESARVIFIEKLSVFGVANIEELKTCLANWNANVSRLENLATTSASLEQKIAIETKELSHLATLIKEKQLGLDKVNLALQELWAARKDIFGETLVDEAEEKIKNRIAQCETEKLYAEKVTLEAHTELERNKAILAEKEIALQTLQAMQASDKSLELLQNEALSCRELLDTYSQKMGALKQILEVNEVHVKSSVQQLKNREKQEAIWHKWASLNELIGSSDGKKYRNFAQALTFEHLIAIANKQLQKMSDRYLLHRSGDMANPFELSVIDKYQDSEIRTAQNLSGGEKFIVSLSLALGLANMASKNMRIDTMFIDEGFGTLDSDYLDVALNALSNLQSEGKIIGVISHLSELKERIATHIEVMPSGNGYSKINITNAS